MHLKLLHQESGVVVELEKSRVVIPEFAWKRMKTAVNNSQILTSRQDRNIIAKKERVA